MVAAPINPADLLVLAGEHGQLPPLPAIGGREGVGRVVEVAPGLEGPAIGRLVLLPFGWGSWSTHVVVEATGLVSLPEEADPQQLAMMTINPPTASLLLSEFVDCLSQDATLVSYGRMSGEPCTVAVDTFVFRNLTMRGFWLVHWFRHTSEEARADLYDEIGRLIAAGTLYAPIHATYDVSEIKEAVAAAASGGRSGKILVVPRH